MARNLLPSAPSRGTRLPLRCYVRTMGGTILIARWIARAATCRERIEWSKVSVPDGVSVEPVGPATLNEYVLVKPKGFANSEDESPRGTSLKKPRSEPENHRRPLYLAKVNGEPAAAIAFWSMTAWSSSWLTRVPMRNRGIARILFCRTIARASEKGCRSVIIKANHEVTPLRWYRRLGFDDEVYWLRSYVSRLKP